jgi:hypothetical protein
MASTNTTNQNEKYSSLIKRCENIKSLFKNNNDDTYYEFANLFFDIDGTDTTNSVPDGDDFNNIKKYISYLLNDAIKGEIQSIEYDNAKDYLKSTNNPSPLYFIKSDDSGSADVPIDIAAADYNTHEAQFFVNAADSEFIGQAVTTAGAKYRYYQDDNKIKYILCTLKLIETFLNILSAYKDYIDEPENEAKIINNIIITDCKNTTKVGANDYNHGYFVESDDGGNKLKDGSSLLLYIKDFTSNQLLTSNASYHKLNSTEYYSSGSNTSVSYNSSNNTFDNTYLRGIFIKKNNDTIKLTIETTGSTTTIKDLNNIPSTYTDTNDRYKIICNYYLTAFLELIFYLNIEKRNEQIEALIAQLEIYKLSIYTCIYACNKLFNTFLENALIDTTKGIRINTRYHCILPHAITDDKININTTDNTASKTENDGKLNNIFTEIYNNTSTTNYQYYTTYFSRGNNDDTHYYKKKSNAAVEVSTQAYIPIVHLQSKDLADNLSLELHYYKFNKLNDNIMEHVTRKTSDLLTKYYKGTNSTIQDVFEGGGYFAIEIHDIDRNIYVVKTPKDILRNIILHDDFDDTISSDEHQLFIKGDVNYYNSYSAASGKQEKKNKKENYLNSITYGLNKSFFDSNADFKKHFSDIELYKYKIVNDYILNINENNYNIKNIYYDENDNLVISIYAEDKKKLVRPSPNSDVLLIKDITDIKSFEQYSPQNDDPIKNGYNFIFESPNSIKIMKKTPIQFKNNYNNNIRDINDLNEKININQSKLKNYKTIYELNKSKNTIMYNQYYAYLIISIIIFCVLIGINFYPMENSIKKLIAMVCFGIAIMLFISYFVVNVAYIEGFANVEGFAMGAIDNETYGDFFNTLSTPSGDGSGPNTITINGVKEFNTTTLENKIEYVNERMITLQEKIFELLSNFEIYRRQASSGSAYYKLTEITENERRNRYNIDNRLLYEKNGANMHIDVLKYETLRYSIIIKSILMALFIITGMYTIFLYINGKNMEIIIFITLLLLIIVFCYFLIYSNSIVRTKSKDIYWGKAFESTYEK